VVKVNINGYEKGLSYRFAKLLARTSVDAINLIFAGSENVFNQYSIKGERIYELFHRNLTVSEDRLLCSIANHKDLLPMEPDENFEEYREALVEIFEEVVQEGGKKALVERWMTALDWFAEGCREPINTIAITKMVTALDVLAQASKAQPICEMLKNLLNLHEKAEVFFVKAEEVKYTLERAVEIIYNDSRSRFVHGGLLDRLEPYEIERTMAFNLGRQALIKAVIKLKNYSGPGDDAKAFRTM
jgi:hypothetical protein